MKLVIKFEIEKEHLVWAAYSWLYTIQSKTRYQCEIASRARLSKHSVVTYLKEQITMFGSGEDSLMGSNYVDNRNSGDLDTDVNYQTAVQWVLKTFPEIM